MARARLQALLDRAVAEWGQPGLAAVVVDGDDTSLAAAGTTGGAAGHAVTPRTLFALASCTKPFASLSVAMLATDGVLDLDDRVVRHLPDFRLSDPAVAREVRVRDLLANRLGITSSEGRHRRFARSRRDLVRRLRFQPFRHPFGAGYGYTTDAFSVAGRLVDVVAGEPWEALAAQRIWRPLGMARTNADSRAAVADADSATPHVWTDRGAVPIAWRYEDHVATPAGGMNSCAEDLGRAISAFLDPARAPLSVDPAILAQCFEPQTAETGDFAEHELASVVGHGPEGIEAPAYGLGWYLHRQRGVGVALHTGRIDGFRSILGIVPEIGFGAAILCNSDCQFLARALFQQLVEDRLWPDRGTDWLARFRARQPEALPPPEADAGLVAIAGDDPIAGELVGRYLDRTGYGPACVRADRDGLWMQVSARRLRLHRSGAGLAAVDPETGLRLDLEPMRVEGESLSLAGRDGALFVRRGGRAGG